RANLRQTWIAEKVASHAMVRARRNFERMITREIRRIRPDVVMTMPHLVVNVQAVLASRRRISFPLVMAPMLHENDPNWNVSLMQDALRSANAVIALTADETERLTTTYRVPKEKIFLASPGVDVEEELPHGHSRHERIVFRGRKSKAK